MSNSFNARPFLRIRNIAQVLCGLSLIVLLTGPKTFALPTTVVKPCSVSAKDFDTSTDIHAIDSYENAIRQLLDSEDFDRLECIANAARSGKTKFSGGLWELHNFYLSIQKPQGHATDEDWQNYLAKLDKWASVKPDSVTARIALANAYEAYGWVARGDGYSDSVTESGWRLFGERVAKAQSILQEADKLQAKCPEWFVVMLQISRDQSWDSDAAADLFKRAVVFEPDYYYYYRLRAAYLSPKWSGEEGDTAKFAADSANSIGGKDGDILYFQMAETLVCCEKDAFLQMSWPRLQNGYLQLVAKFGKDLHASNFLARMAVRENDGIVADGAFKEIGENWDEDTWGTKDFFNDNRSWAADAAEGARNNAALKREAEDNIRTPGGLQYKEKFDQNLAAFMQNCVQKESTDTKKFEFFVRVGKNGNIENVLMPDPTPVAKCLFNEFLRSAKAKETPFPLPPTPSYWVELELDPMAVKMAQK